MFIEQKISRILKSQLDIRLSNNSTFLLLIAFNKINKSKNVINYISCKKALPIGGFVYDSQMDSYCINCCDYIELGSVPISIEISIKDCFNWVTKTPLPEKIFKKYLNTYQKKEIKNFISKFNEDYDISYVQMIEPNLSTIR